MASAMAAVVPPYSGGKVYATQHGVFTFVNVLFDLDGGSCARSTATRSHGCARLPPARSPSAPWPRPSRRPRRWSAPAARAGSTWRCSPPSCRSSHGRACYDRPPKRRWRTRRARRTQPASQRWPPRHAAESGRRRRRGRHRHAAAPSRCSAPTSSATAPCICAVGATKYDRCEIGADVVERCAAVVCDDVVGSHVECGDLIHAAAAGAFDWDRAIELSDLLAGNVHVPPCRRRAGAVRDPGRGPAGCRRRRASPTSATATRIRPSH